MPCPKCHSTYLWDDNLAWGCHECDFFTTGDIQNVGSVKDKFLTHEEFREVRGRKAEAERPREPRGTRGGLMDDAFDLAGDVLSAAGNVISGTANVAGSAISGAADVAGNVLSGAADVAGGVAGAIGDAIGSIAD
jgi:hypothetical protein